MKFNVYVLSFLFQVTIKKTLQDFKRTHQDNWQEHKLRFSDDQMAVLTDLLVSPSYYAWSATSTGYIKKYQYHI